jgi:hypothetical protein
MGVNLRATDAILLDLVPCVVTPSSTERQRNVPRLGDISIPKLAALPNHFVRLYIPGVEDLFKVGDRLLRVEHNGSSSRLIS